MQINAVEINERKGAMVIRFLAKVGAKRRVQHVASTVEDAKAYAATEDARIVTLAELIAEE